MARLSCLLVTLAVCFLFSNVHARPMTHFHFYGKIECPKVVLRYQIYAREYSFDYRHSFRELAKTPFQVAHKPYSYDLKFSTNITELATDYDVALVISHDCTDDGSTKDFGIVPQTIDGLGQFYQSGNHTVELNFPNILNAEHKITKNDW
ncbi:hypothetical protein GCK72_021889 [Caenorhabditis remanei]|uniref:Uncharacterized protein n=1 Tax=Caenorhabditis remanei TaxID=31234 RepID=A0A6A5GJ97_CAERE|nr:hypothetical protein GCK72_021889 [Caenorhabditis remanei]KAF1755320.1 hypothetical protein GCK72_021889 [Caenorhabditis remanei]